MKKQLLSCCLAALGLTTAIQAQNFNEWKDPEELCARYVLSFDSQIVTWCKNKCSLPINTILLANLLKNEAMDSCRNHYLCCFYFFFSLILLPLLADIISYNYSYA